MQSEEKEIKNLLKASGFKNALEMICGLRGTTLTILDQNSDPTRQKKTKKQDKNRKQDDWQDKKRCGKTPGGGFDGEEEDGQDTREKQEEEEGFKGSG